MKSPEKPSPLKEIHGIIDDETGIPLFQDFSGMEKAGVLAADVLDYIAPYVQEGITTDALNALCHTYILDHGAIPAPLNYHGFPKSICTSVNHEVCHGIPGPYMLKKGDVLNIDVTVILEGWYGDTSTMFAIGDPQPAVKRCMDVTKEALRRAIQHVYPGQYLGTLGHTIETFVKSQGFSVVQDFCGHGIGRVFHGAPEVPHFGRPKTGIRLKEGMCFTIEPMVNMGKHQTKILADGWTAVTKDRKVSCQYEHTLGVTKEGCKIFTKSRGCTFF